jgi:REP-associated tyrosine transposase
MLIQHYQPHELRFAYCYRIYLRWRTYRSRVCLPLLGIDNDILNTLAQPYGIRVLECATSKTDVATMVSLQPTETISTCASKLKGQLSKYLRSELQLKEPEHLLSRGYFGCTVGKSNALQIERYLESQAEHHGYDKRVLPPIFVEKYAVNAADEARLIAKHASVLAQFHIVLATRWRRGVFGASEGKKIAQEWRKLQTDLRIAIIKVSFVPDHVHIALRTHPSVSVPDTIAALMNTAQDIIPNALVGVGLDQLWQPSAYLGSYGDLTSPQIRKYIESLQKDW